MCLMRRRNRIILDEVTFVVHAAQSNSSIVHQQVQMFKSLLNKSLQSFGNALAAECDHPATVAHLAGWWIETGVLGGSGASQCFHGNRKHSALAAYSLWNPVVFTVQPQLIFPIERADLWLCLFAHKKFADVSVERGDGGQTETAKGQGDKEWERNVLWLSGYHYSDSKGKNISHPLLSLFNLAKLHSRPWR